MGRGMMVILCLLLLLTGCEGQSVRQQSALEEFLLPIYAAADDPAQYQICHASDGRWYLYHWEDHETLLSGSRRGDAYPLDYDPDTVVHEPCDDFTITVESTDLTKLCYTITNHSEHPITLNRIRWLDVQLAGAWYRLWLGGVSQLTLRERIDPGEVLTQTRTVRLESAPIALPPGQYRWCFVMTVGAENARRQVPCAVAFDIPVSE